MMRIERCFRIIFVILLSLGTVSSANALPANGETTWFSTNLEQFEGRFVSRLTFLTWVNLNGDELAGSIPLGSGMDFSLPLVRRSVEDLYLRDMFEHIEPRVRERADGIEVQFILTPVLRVNEIAFEGNSSISDDVLRRRMALRAGTLLDMDVLFATARQLEKVYRLHGFYQPTVHVRLSEAIAEPSVTAVFAIDEGPQAKISVVNFDGVVPDDLRRVVASARDFGEGLPASEEVIERIRWETLLAFRKEGYLQASVEVTKQAFQELTGDVEVTLGANVREPVTLYFEGNSVFTAEELLAPLKLATRRVPFTPSAIQSLRRDIVTLYQQKGYYFVTVAPFEENERSGRHVYRISINEGEVWRAKELSFEGNKAFDEQELASVIQTSGAGWWPVRGWIPGFVVDGVLQKDVEALSKYYESLGYPGTKVSVTVDNIGEPDLRVRYRIDESQAQEVKQIDVHWQLPDPSSVPSHAPQIGLLDITSVLPVGQVITSEKIEIERRRILEVVQSRGFPNAQVVVDGVNSEGVLAYLVNPGIAVRIGRVWLQGNAYTHDKVLLDELQFTQGQPWNNEAINRSQRALYGLGFFRRVEVGPLDGTLDDSIEDVRVRVRERDTGSFAAGGSFTTEDGLHLSNEIAQRNLFGSGSGLIFGLDGFFKTGSRLFDAGRIRAAYARPRFLDTPVDFSFEGFFHSNLALVDQFSFDRVGTAADWRFGVLENIRGSFGVTAFLERLFDVEEDIIITPADEGNTFYTFLESSFEIDLRDDVYNPRSGSRTVLELSLASEALGSEENLFGTTVGQSLFIPLSTRVVWASHFSGDYILPYASTEVVPLGQRVFLGGRYSLRGYSRNAIGPRGRLGNVAGGDSSLNVQTELHYDFSEGLVGLIFLDLGQAFLLREGSFDGDQTNLGDIRFSPGLGVHYKTPIGPLSAEYGFATDREYGERFGRLNVGIGTAF